MFDTKFSRSLSIHSTIIIIPRNTYGMNMNDVLLYEKCRVHFILTYLSLLPVELPVHLHHPYLPSFVITSVYNYLHINMIVSFIHQFRIIGTRHYYSRVHLHGPNHPKSNGNSIESPIELRYIPYLKEYCTIRLRAISSHFGRS